MWAFFSLSLRKTQKQSVDFNRNRQKYSWHQKTNRNFQRESENRNTSWIHLNRNRLTFPSSARVQRDKPKLLNYERRFHLSSQLRLTCQPHSPAVSGPISSWQSADITHIKHWSCCCFICAHFKVTALIKHLVMKHPEREALNSHIIIINSMLSDGRSLFSHQVETKTKFCQFCLYYCEHASVSVSTSF